jgi:hypothetical protein
MLGLFEDGIVVVGYRRGPTPSGQVARMRGGPVPWRMALLGFVLLVVWRAAPLLVVTLGALAGLAWTLLG